MLGQLRLIPASRALLFLVPQAKVGLILTPQRAPRSVPPTYGPRCGEAREQPCGYIPGFTDWVTSRAGIQGSVTGESRAEGSPERRHHSRRIQHLHAQYLRHSASEPPPASQALPAQFLFQPTTCAPRYPDGISRKRRNLLHLPRRCFSPLWHFFNWSQTGVALKRRARTAW